MMQSLMTKQQVEKSALIHPQLGLHKVAQGASVAGTDQVGTADENQISSVIMVLIIREQTLQDKFVTIN